MSAEPNESNDPEPPPADDPVLEQDPPGSQDPPAAPAPRWWVQIGRFCERSLACAGVFFLIYHAGFGVTEVISPSMSPTLDGHEAGNPKNDWILYEHVTSLPPPRTKLLLWQSREGISIAKRVMAFPGETVQIVGGKVEVDGTPVELEGVAAGVRYLKAGKVGPSKAGPRRYTVPPETVFILGDDSKDSWDSRFFGGLKKDRWRGRVIGIIWPPARWKWLY